MILIYYKSEQFSIESTKRIWEQDEDLHKDEKKEEKKDGFIYWRLYIIS